MNTRKPTDLILGLAARLAFIRATNGLTQTAFARSIGVSGPAYHAYERGTRSIPVRALMHVAEDYGIDARWLFFGTGLPEKGADLKAHVEFVSILLIHIDKHEIKIPAQAIAAIIDRWNRELDKGRLVRFEDVEIWVDLLKE